MTTTYQPGVCNIGPAERRQRRMLGWVGLVVTVLAVVAFFAFNVPAPWRVLVALPAALSANGFLQSAMHFCVGFAMRGLYNMGTALGSEESIVEADMRRADQKKGALITLYSLLIAAAVVVLAIVPTFFG